VIELGNLHIFNKCTRETCPAIFERWIITIQSESDHTSKL